MSDWDNARPWWVGPAPRYDNNPPSSHFNYRCIVEPIKLYDFIIQHKSQATLWVVKAATPEEALLQHLREGFKGRVGVAEPFCVQRSGFEGRPVSFVVEAAVTYVVTRG